MQNTTNKTLTVYKASAGSGKTFTLATEYIKLLILNPQNYQYILAVTFTNKATEEMKQRILSQLYGIAHQLSDSQQYLQEIRQSTELSDAQIKERAAIALTLLLHNYSYFHVETIDKFFQRVLRNLARELDLTANLRIELNDSEVLDKAVDEIIDDLLPESSQLNWINNFINQNIEDNKTWNITKQLKSFGYNLFKDIYKEEHVLNKQNGRFDEAFYRCLEQQLKQQRKNFLDIADRTITELSKYIDGNNLPIDEFSNGKTGPAGILLKLKGKTFERNELFKKRLLAAMNDPKAWFSKAKLKDNPAYEQVGKKLTNIVKTFEADYQRLYIHYVSSNIILEQLTQIRLLDSIEQKIRDLNAMSNSFLLSDTQTLLKGLINKNDASFIFEKLGGHIKHIMIDEFQDTSTVQWNNFNVLLQDCMSQADSQNLIVGDVKQSIYRWRSGDWKLLNNIYDNLTLAQQSMLTEQSLQTNYRSCRRVIEFNNMFFQHAVALECNLLIQDKNENGAQQFKKAYEDVLQNVPDSKPNSGYVSVKLLPTNAAEDDTLNEIVNIVSILLSQNASQNDIAILVRSNKHISMIADKLVKTNPNINIISDEAFRLDASVAVNILIAALRYLVHCDDLLSLSHLVKLYQMYICNTNSADNDLFLDKEASEQQLANNPNNTLSKQEHYKIQHDKQRKHMENWLPSAFVNQTNKLLVMPIIECVEQLYMIFQLDKLQEQNAYICAFYDIVNQYLSDNLTDLEDFLQQWDDSYHKTNIQSDSLNGIRVMTIHKSKGLEFGHVIIAFCDWELEKSNILWCKPDVEPYNALPLIPVKYSQSTMDDSIFEGNYQEEYLQNMVDNMNLLYVAFTRAEQSLHVIANRKNKKYRSLTIENTLEEIAKVLSPCIYSPANNKDEDNTTLEYGELSIAHHRQKQSSTNIFLIPKDRQMVYIKSFDKPLYYRQSNKSKEFVAQTSDEENTQKGYIAIGNVIHQLLSNIATVADIEPSLRNFEENGIIDGKQITPSKIIRIVNNLLHNNEAKEWFTTKWQVLNERSIASIDPITGKIHKYRPDRVMIYNEEAIVIDFKFGIPKPQYNCQILQYMALLKDIGYTNVKGYLWYGYTNKIEQVYEQ